MTHACSPVLGGRRRRLHASSRSALVEKGVPGQPGQHSNIIRPCLWKGGGREGRKEGNYGGSSLGKLRPRTLCKLARDLPVLQQCVLFSRGVTSGPFASLISQLISVPFLPTSGPLPSHLLSTCKSGRPHQCPSSQGVSSGAEPQPLLQST